MRKRSQLTLALLLASAFRLHAESLLTSQPGTALPTNAWTRLYPHGYPGQVLGYENLVYSSAIKRSITYGSYHSQNNETQQSFWGFSYDENRIDILDVGGDFYSEHLSEGGHSVDQLSYMPLRNSMVHIGTNSAGNQPIRPNETWWYDVVGMSGLSKEPGTHPNALPSGCQAGAQAYDRLHDKTVYYGCSQGTWEYDPALNTWSQKTTFGTAPPTAIAQITMVYNSYDHKIYLFGGHTSGSSCPSITFNSDVYSYDQPTATWTKLTVSGTAPSGREMVGVDFDTRNNIALLTGGRNCSGAGGASAALNDLFAFDPVALSWAQLSPTSTYTPQVSETSASFYRLAYDEDNNVFILLTKGDGTYGDGTYGTLSAAVWAYSYSSAPNYGRVTNPYPVPTGINVANNSWGKEPAIAAGSGSDLYAASIQSASAFDSTLCKQFHPYVSKNTAGAWSNLGSNCAAIDSENGSALDSAKTSLAFVNGVPWVSWERGAIGQVPWAIAAKFWDGTSWVGGPIGLRETGATFYQSISRLFGVGTTPHIVFLENTHVQPDTANAYVDQFNGTSWVALGGALNRAAGTRAKSIGAMSDGTNAHVCWSEEVVTSNTVVQPGQIYESKWNGSAWIAEGGSINQSASNWADQASCIWLNGQPYVAFVERTTAGNPKVYVKTTANGGTTWTLVGGAALNKNLSAGWAAVPKLTTDNTNLYLSWEEQQTQNAPSRPYVSRWDGASWAALGGTPAGDSAYGSAQYTAIGGTAPAIAWGEVKMGTPRQIFAAQWNGTDWGALGAAPPPPPPPPPSPSRTISGRAKVSGKAAAR